MSGPELKARRTRAKVSRQEIALALKTSPAFVQRVEEGWRSVPDDYPTRFLAALAGITGRRHEAALAEPCEVV